MDYDYRKALYDDIMNYITDNHINLNEYDSRSQFEGFLSDELWMEDSITGNGGDYYADKYKCEEFICHNWDLVREIADTFELDFGSSFREYGSAFPQYIDCCIRCYLLTEIIEKVVTDLEKSGCTYKEEE